MAKAKPAKKQKVDSKGIAAQYLSACLDMLNQGKTFVACLDFLQLKAIKACPDATADALKNCRGRWFEILLVLAANRAVQDQNKLFLKLGTASDHSIFDVFSDLGSISPPDSFTINLSIPDMIFVDASSSPALQDWKSALSSSTDNSQIVGSILQAHKVVTSNQIQTLQCKAFCSIKTSLRPDRKYQAMYEAESIRALQKRVPHWAAKYFMVGPLEANATREILESNLSLIALADNHQTPYKTVDQIFIVDNLASLRGFTQTCLDLA